MIDWSVDGVIAIGIDILIKNPRAFWGNFLKAMNFLQKEGINMPQPNSSSVGGVNIVHINGMIPKLVHDRHKIIFKLFGPCIFYDAIIR